MQKTSKCKHIKSAMDEGGKYQMQSPSLLTLGGLLADSEYGDPFTVGVQARRVCTVFDVARLYSLRYQVLVSVPLLRQVFYRIPVSRKRAVSPQVESVLLM